MNNGYQKSNGCGADKEGWKIFNTFFYPKLQSKHVSPLAYNSNIYEQNHKSMKATALGIWYVQIPSGIVVNPLGEVITPKDHKGSKYVVVDRKYKSVSNLPKLDYQEAMLFKEIFCE